MQTTVQPEAFQELQQRLAYAEHLQQIINQIHSAKDLDHILVDLKDEILGLFDAERLTLYAVDAERKEIYSKFLDIDEVKEIRVPISEQSIAGFVAKYRRPINIGDAYNRVELNAISPALIFDSSWDKKSGFRTKQILTYPIVAENKYLVGVIQLVNKKSGGRFTKKDEESVVEITKTLGIAFYTQFKLARKTPTKFDSLVANSRITQAELDVAIAEARKGQTDVESILLDKYKVPKAEIGKSLSQFYKCPFIEYDDRTAIEPELLKTLNMDYLKKNFWIPLKRDKDGIQILIDDPNNLDRIQDIKRIFPGRNVQFAVGLRRDILQFLYAASGEADPLAAKGSLAEIMGELVSEAELEKQDDVSTAAMDENDSAIVRLANQIITDAYKQGASDIHVEPYGEKRETMIRFRVDGSCFEYQKIPPTYRRALVSRYKIMSRLDIAERRKPQDGKIKFLVGNKEIELRVATVPTAGFNEDIVMRILAASEPLPLEKLNMSERNLREVKNIAAKPYGIILCVGPTGSGKTTTLHAILGYINTPERKIWTAEDPVEITQYGLRQVQMQPKIGLTFAAAMRAFLRADPDVIMVGEMRDKETAETGVEASLTGHLVFSTLHTNSAVETVTRLLEMGMDPFNFADALLGVLAQRLCKTICKECKEKYHPPKEAFDELALSFGAEAFVKLGYKYDDSFVLYRGKGCETCKNTGYKGRTGLHELLIGTDDIKRMIQKRATAEELLKVAREQGMTTLVQDGVIKVIQGWTDFKQVKAVAIK
ncbi:MAG: pilus assembly protein [candidate division NC10 bacterium RIFCSPLOWO2_02_FULL_66_22]|nr:MAG: pilus assembly protein [candidate division NC10 bacterium RIFCSPLOWO2_02_FULL_66_22]